jgi:hypothetical protein
MSEIVDHVAAMTSFGWKLLCAVSVLALGLLVLDRRAKDRAVRQVRRAEKERQRRAA